MKEFYERDENAARLISNLNQHIEELRAALHHAGVTSQKDRIALNNAHDHQKMLEKAFEACEQARTSCENVLHAERQEFRACQEALTHERIRHEETDKSLICVWNANSRLEKLFSSIQSETDNNNANSSFDLCDVPNLLLEIEAKALRISQLEAIIANGKQSGEDEVCHRDERLRYLTFQHADLTCSQKKIMQGSDKFPRQSSSQPEHISVGKRRKRNGGRRKLNAMKKNCESVERDLHKEELNVT